MAKKEVSKSNKKVEESASAGMPLVKENYILMLVGFAVIVLGFVLMAGGGSDDPNVFNYEMFNFRRITLAPILILGGLALEVYAIMKKSKRDK